MKIWTLIAIVKKTEHVILTGTHREVENWLNKHSTAPEYLWVDSYKLRSSY